MLMCYVDRDWGNDNAFTVCFLNLSFKFKVNFEEEFAFNFFMTFLLFFGLIL